MIYHPIELDSSESSVAQLPRIRPKSYQSAAPVSSYIPPPKARDYQRNLIPPTPHRRVYTPSRLRQYEIKRSHPYVTDIPEIKINNRPYSTGRSKTPVGLREGELGLAIYHTEFGLMVCQVSRMSQFYGEIFPGDVIVRIDDVYSEKYENARDFQRIVRFAKGDVNVIEIYKDKNEEYSNFLKNLAYSVSESRRELERVIREQSFVWI